MVEKKKERENNENPILVGIRRNTLEIVTLLILGNTTTNHGAEEMRFALSVRQWVWVNSGRCLYAPLAVRRCAYAHMTVTDVRRANRSNIGSCFVWKCFKYCTNQQAQPLEMIFIYGEIFHQVCRKT